MKRERVIRLPRPWTNQLPKPINRPHYHDQNHSDWNWLREGLEMLALLDIIESMQKKKAHSH
ncbi:MAG: hypothetical protein DRH12_07215 [Deltaproteobacteria bacterium]|nr:MAG: hypothetical protein DRH12_07215 [Deltaproteobacteria bacterium]